MIPLSQFCKRKVKSANRKLIKKSPWKFNESLVAKPENQESIVTAEVDDKKQRVLMPGHQGWNALHILCRIGMKYYLLNMYLNATVCHIIMAKSHHILSY